MYGLHKSINALWVWATAIILTYPHPGHHSRHPGHHSRHPGPEWSILIGPDPPDTRLSLVESYHAGVSAIDTQLQACKMHSKDLLQPPLCN